MKGIVYVSKAVVDFDPLALYQLAAFASDCNAQYDITGYLYYEKKYFLQYIEGENDTVDTLIRNIKKDERHEMVYIEENTEIKERKFPTWHMHQLTKSSLIQINMENVLMDYMTHCSKQDYINVNQGHIWRMIDKLSNFRKKLSENVY